jgi:hypothetical protein
MGLIAKIGNLINPLWSVFWEFAMRKLVAIVLSTIIATELILSSSLFLGPGPHLLLTSSRVDAVLPTSGQRLPQQPTSTLTGQQELFPTAQHLPGARANSLASGFSPSPSPGVPNQIRLTSPIANAGQNKIAYPGTTVVLNGLGSYDRNLGGSLVYYKWMQLSGIPITLVGGSNSPNPTFIAPRLPIAAPEIILTFSLTVTDNFGLTSTNPSTTNVIVTYNPQYQHLPLNSLLGTPPNVGLPQQQQQQLLHPYAMPTSPKVTSNAVPSPPYPYQSRPAPAPPPVIYRFSHNVSPYTRYYGPSPNNLSQSPYQNQSLGTSSAAQQLRNNLIPYPNSTQYQYQYRYHYSGPTGTATMTAKQNNILQKPHVVTNRTAALTNTTQGIKSVLQPNNNGILPSAAGLTHATSSSHPSNSTSPQSPTSPNLLNSNATTNSPTSATNTTTSPSGTSTAEARNGNTSNASANQTKMSEGVQFLGQVNVRALKSLGVAAKAQPKEIPFHPRDPIAFANAKRQAELNLIRPQVKVFSHQNTNNRSAVSPAAAISSSPLSSSPTLTSSALIKSVTGFDGLTESQAGSFYPPDVQVAAGPTYIMEMVNLGGEIFTKQGSSVSTFDLPTFFKITGQSDLASDPKIIYDAMSGRWFASLLDANKTTNDVRIAVSATSDPTGVWNVYRFGFSDCPDQPLIGISNDKFAVSANDFKSVCDGAFTGEQHYIIDKADLVKGISSPGFIESQPDTSTFSLFPAQSLSSTSTLYMVSVSDDLTNFITLDSFTGSVPNVVKSTMSLGIQITHIPPGGVQPGTNFKVDTGDARVLDAAWYQGKLWLTLGDACKPPGDSTVRSCIRLDQLDTAANKVLQDFDKGDIGIYYFYPALRMDSSGNLDFIYGYSSANTFPSLSASGQAVGATIDTLDQPVTLKSGSAADTSGRYGDYFGAGVDPANPNNVWVAGEYHSTSDWSTFIAQTSRSNIWSGYSSLGGNVLGDPASARNSDGRLEVFVVQSDHALYHKSETVAGSSSGWTAYSSLGGYIIGNPAVAQNSDGRLEVFGIGGNHALYHKSQITAGSSTWSGYASLGGYLISDPVVARNSDGRLQVFAIGSNHALYTISQLSASGGSWSGFSSLGGNIIGNPAVAQNSDGRLEVFVVQSDHALYHKSQITAGSSTWSGYASLGGYSISDPVVARNSDGRLQAFVIGSNHALYTTSQLSASGGSWSGFSSLGGTIANNTKPAAALNSGNQLQVFVINTDNSVLYKYQIAPGSGTWSSYVSLGGIVTSNPVVATNSDGRLELFVIGSNHALYHNFQLSP